MSGKVVWDDEKTRFLVENYSTKGKTWCAERLGFSEGSVRYKAADLGLRLDTSSAFYRDSVKRRSQTVTGRKRPGQAVVMKRLHESGALKKTDAQKTAVSERMKKWHSENEHPRGALGMKHSEETKGMISEKTKLALANMSDEKKYAHARRASATARKISPMTRANGTSWKAGWHEIGGVKKYYRSKWEANYARYLQWLKERGEIESWRHECKTFWFEGIRRGCMSYLPDFEVIEKNGSVVYHEVKGWMDDRSKTKIKRMAKYHPSVRLIVIDSKQYRDLQKKVSCIIPGWE